MKDKFKIISDGTGKGTRIVNAEGQDAVDPALIQRISIEITHRGVSATVDLTPCGLEVGGGSSSDLTERTSAEFKSGTYNS